tara:strand:+ start:30 stop:635 length:606 start_codon:yes stop_codon:yes gene_type:complete
MANNFINKIKTNVSAESSAPTEIYYHASKKAIVIELDASNKSSAGVTIGVGVEDTTENGSALTSLTVATNGTFTRTAHGLSVNDRVTIQATTFPTIATGSSDTLLLATRRYFVQAVTANTFHLSETRSATTAITFSNTGSLTSVTKHHFAEVIRDAPIPVGGALKVISGQKLVLESTDRLYVWSSSASNVDVICSILEDVS